MEWSKGEFMVSDEISLMNLDTVSYLLSSTYWAAKRTKETIETSIHNSISFGVYHNNKQIGFARVVTDKAVFSWVLDVVIDERYRKNGLGQWLMECILEHPEIKNTKFALATSDAHGFYKKFNFKENQCMTRV
ncbi:GNAT family N-acetyltransferase [Domibacillus indicus]|uniref:GNAT family N-acetyltransferase n=1 Tax=Domibacillus indicus TaxID=1437523 RepID=UPI002040AFC0|nr:GNAT family N-acetyltransferase [Domibacillus indicus]MCM3791293.1 GNAT family N-acetyltransferase [Domibacillus indicus]